MAEVTLRVRCKAESYIVKNLTNISTCDELKDAITVVTSLNKNCFRILTGFPPKPKNLYDEGQTLQDVGIKSGDTLIIESLAVADILKTNFKNCKKPPVLMGGSPGLFMKKGVPADNSCLFTSIYFIISEGGIDSSCAKAMRKVIVDIVRADHETYSEVILGKSNKEYRNWISNSDSWGGAIELSILSSHFGLELDVVDAQTGRIDRFGEDRCYPCRGFLLYSGIHYDPLMLEQNSGLSMGNETVPPNQIRTIFSTEDDAIFQMAMEVGAEAKRSQQYTDVNSFALQCLVCKEGLKSQLEAVKHAKETGHANFNEVPS